MKSAEEFFKGDELAITVWRTKYKADSEEFPEQTFRRLAKEFARIENNYPDPQLSEDEIYELFSTFTIIPGGSVISGLGNNEAVSLSNCFVIKSPGDTMESILNTARDAAQIYKKRGGVGFDISNLRPNGSLVHNAAKSSSGPVSFMSLYSQITEVSAQNGRRGALMLSIDGRHPDVDEFITCKQGDNSKITGANISVRLHKDFYEAVKKDEDYILRWPIDLDINKFTKEYTDTPYNTICFILDHENKNKACYIKKVRAKELWDKMIQAAHSSAEPGIFNWDFLTDYDPTGVYPELKPICTNPCGELGLGAYDSCRLISVNLYNLVKNPFTKEAYIEVSDAFDIFYKAQRLADNLVDLELEAVDRILEKIRPKWKTWLNPQNEFDSKFINQQTEEFKLWWKIREIGAKGRRTGTGITGYADMCAALGVNYGDPGVTKFIFEYKLEAELTSSIIMAQERGAFPLYNKELEYKTTSNIPQNSWYKFIKENHISEYIKMLENKRRNSGISTVAPTGSISILAGVSGGIEPVFMPYYKRRKRCLPDEEPTFVDENGMGFTEYLVIHDKLKEWFIIESKCQDCPEVALKGLSEMTLDELQSIFEKSPYYNNCANDISYDIRIDTQALVQKYITSSISSTVNLPEKTPVEVVDNIYRRIFEEGCKGVTVYRDGSRSGILVAATSKRGDVYPNGVTKRPKSLEADYYVTTAKGTEWIVLVGLYEGTPYEIFAFQPKEGVKIPKEQHKGIITKVRKGQYMFDSELINISDLQLANDKLEEHTCGLVASTMLRHGVEIQYIIKTIKKTNTNIVSFASALCRILSKYMGTIYLKEKCPEEGCEGNLIHENGCVHCDTCHYSQC